MVVAGERLGDGPLGDRDGIERIPFDAGVIFGIHHEGLAGVSVGFGWRLGGGRRGQ